MSLYTGIECPNCMSKNTELVEHDNPSGVPDDYAYRICRDCGHEYK